MRSEGDDIITGFAFYKKMNRAFKAANIIHKKTSALRPERLLEFVFEKSVNLTL